MGSKVSGKIYSWDFHFGADKHEFSRNQLSSFWRLFESSESRNHVALQMEIAVWELRVNILGPKH